MPLYWTAYFAMFFILMIMSIFTYGGYMFLGGSTSPSYKFSSELWCW